MPIADGAMDKKRVGRKKTAGGRKRKEAQRHDSDDGVDAKRARRSASPEDVCSVASNPASSTCTPEPAPTCNDSHEYTSPSNQNEADSDGAEARHGEDFAAVYESDELLDSDGDGATCKRDRDALMPDDVSGLLGDPSAITGRADSPPPSSLPPPTMPAQSLPDDGKSSVEVVPQIMPSQIPAMPVAPSSAPERLSVAPEGTLADPTVRTLPGGANGHSNSSAAPISGLLDCVLGRHHEPKLYCCQDHDARDVRGACSLIVAVDESSARGYLDSALKRHGYKPHSSAAYTIIRLPVHRECGYFIGAIYRSKLEEQIGKEDSLLLERIKPKDVQRLRIFYGFTDDHRVSTGYVAASLSSDGARFVLLAESSGTTSNDQIGLFGVTKHVERLVLHEMPMRNGMVVSSLFPSTAPRSYARS